MTVPDALSTLSRLGVWMVHDAHFPSVSVAVAGGPVRGSWWGHPEGKRIYAILEALLEHGDTLSVKLLDGKDTLVHRRLWPSLLGVVTSGAAWQLEGLDTAAAETLARIQASGPTQGAGPVFATLARRLLMCAGRVHTVSGKHVTEVESWAAWARREGVTPAGPDGLEAAVEAACPGAARRLPWRK